MRILWILLLPFFMFANSYGLKTFINHADKNNALIQAKELQIQAKAKGIEAVQSAYWPTLDVGASYAKVTPNALVSPGETATLLASLSVDLYDGGRKSALVNAKSFEHEASIFEKRAFQKSITLKIVRHYYMIQVHQATYNALLKRSKELKAQINRVKQFQNTGLATQEDVDRLQAAYENNAYTLANTELSIETSQENLKLISGLSAKKLKLNLFKTPKHIKFEFFDAIKVMQSNAKAIGENSKAIDAGYMPQVKLSDTYHTSDFDDLASVPNFSSDGLLIDHQNTLSISVNMRLFDNKKMAKESEVVQYQKMVLLSEIEQAKREQKMHFRLAKKSLETSLAKIHSTKSGLKAANSTYDVVKKKYEAGLVDNINFLDALTQKTLAIARDKETMYHYEISKSIYYYYAGKDPKEFIK